jgi:hypothetical protein
MKEIAPRDVVRDQASGTRHVNSPSCGVSSVGGGFQQIEKKNSA